MIEAGMYCCVLMHPRSYFTQGRDTPDILHMGMARRLTSIMIQTL